MLKTAQIQPLEQSLLSLELVWFSPQTGHICHVQGRGQHMLQAAHGSRAHAVHSACTSPALWTGFNM